MTLPPVTDPRVPWVARMKRKAAQDRAARAAERVDELRDWVESERIAHVIRFHCPPPPHGAKATDRAAWVEKMLSHDVPPDEIVQRSSVGIWALVRALERAERTDLRLPFERLVYAARKGRAS